MAQRFPCNGDVLGGLAHHISDPSSVGIFGLESYNKAMIQDEGSGKMYGSLKNFALSQLTSLSHAPNFNSGVGIVTASVNSPPAEARSMFHIPNGVDHWDYSSGSVLCFEQGEQNSHTDYPKIGHEDDYSTWADSMDHNNQWNHLNSKCAVNSRLIDNANCFETASSYYAMDNTNKDNRHSEEQFSLVYSDSMEADDLQEFGGLEGCFNKRPNMGGEMQASKKQCVGAPKKPKPKPIPSKDPQSVAAKNRRERISERLRVLQDLVPNGSKVDLVTMLEKAISYVKFLQLQVKVLATDEFWPAQNGKAPEVGQVKEAIDAILSSHKRRECSSKSEFNKKK